MANYTEAHLYRWGGAVYYTGLSILDVFRSQYSGTLFLTGTELVFEPNPFGQAGGGLKKPLTGNLTLSLRNLARVSVSKKKVLFFQTPICVETYQARRHYFVASMTAGYTGDNERIQAVSLREGVKKVFTGTPSDIVQLIEAQRRTVAN